MKFTLLSILICWSPMATAAELSEIGRIAISGPEHFGGFSGVEVGSDGNDFTAVSDRGWFATGKLIRKDSRLAGAQLEKLSPLADSRENLKVEDFREDAEGLAINATGEIFVSFEGFHRVWLYEQIDGPPKWIHKWNFFWIFQNNSGLEALAVDDKGTIYTLPERSGKWTRPFPVFRYMDGKWIEGWSIPRSEKFLPAGADFGPDGKFYLLERDFTWVGGFSSRIRRFSIGPDGFDQGEVLLRTNPGEYDNMEGIAAWQDSNGSIRLVTISDDNFNPLQNTEFVEFLVME